MSLKIWDIFQIKDDGSIDAGLFGSAIKEEWPNADDQKKILPAGEKCSNDGK